ncbi:MAG: hypothetical protein ACWGPR_08465 [Candidatus Deferrimicrobiaceae bacterium]
MDDLIPQALAFVADRWADAGQTLIALLGSAVAVVVALEGACRALASLFLLTPFEADDEAIPTLQRWADSLHAAATWLSALRPQDPRTKR